MHDIVIFAIIMSLAVALVSFVHFVKDRRDDKSVKERVAALEAVVFKEDRHPCGEAVKPVREARVRKENE